MRPANLIGSEPKPPPLQWLEITRHIQAGDPAAEEELVRFFHPRVLAMATARLKDREAARDIAQQALLSVLQAVRLSKIHEIDKLAAFVRGTARNLINNYARARSRQPACLELCEEDAIATPSLLDEEERKALVHTALKCLKPQDRKILLLTLVDGMNPREIGPLIGLKPDRVRTRKTRAIKVLSQEIARLTRK